MPPSFFSRVGRALSRNRRDKERSDTKDSEPPTPKTPKTPDAAATRPSVDASPQTELGGPYENVSPTGSPSAAAFSDVYKGMQTPTSPGGERGRKGLPGFMSRFTSSNSIPPTSPIANASKRKSAEYLQLPAGLTNGDSDSKTPTTPYSAATTSPTTAGDVAIDDKAVISTILSTADALKLVKATSALVKERGLESLGIFRPHWYAASPDQQARIITLFLGTLAKPQPSPGLAPTSTGNSQLFDSELYYTESPHDIAEVLKWAIRHSKLDSDSFGSTPEQWGWYEAFAQSEKGQSYPSNAFSTILVPTLPNTNADYLKTILDLTSSVASHADSSAMSGSKLSKVFAWWLVSSRRPSGTGWKEFYADWEFSARVLEHLFLAFVRDLGSNIMLPKRLKELVNKYPYEKLAQPSDGVLLPKPRFTTVSFPALLVQLTKDNTSDVVKKPHLVTLIEEAFTAELSVSADSPAGAVWTTLKESAKTEDKDITPTVTAPTASSTPKPSFSLSQVFSDETLQVLSLVHVPAANTNVSIYSPDTPGFILSRPPLPKNRRSFSMNDAERPAAISSVLLDHAKAATASNAELGLGSGDWASFTAGGFGEVGSTAGGLAGTLKQNSVLNGVASPGLKSSLKSPLRDVDGTRSPMRVSLDPGTKPRPPRVNVASELVKLDEAFIDVWADNVVDPVPASNWPVVALCQLKSPATVDSTSVSWVIIEQVLVDPPPPPKAEVEPLTPASLTKRPTPSIKGRSGSRFGSFLPSFRRRASSESDGSDLQRSLSNVSAKPGALTAAGGAGVSELGETVKEEKELSPVQEQETSPIIGAAATVAGGGVALLGAGVGAFTAVLGAVAGSTEEKPGEPEVEKTEVPPAVPAKDIEETPKDGAKTPEPVAEPLVEPASTSGESSDKVVVSSPEPIAEPVTQALVEEADKALEPVAGAQSTSLPAATEAPAAVIVTDSSPAEERPSNLSPDSGLSPVSADVVKEFPIPPNSVAKEELVAAETTPSKSETSLTDLEDNAQILQAEVKQVPEPEQAEVVTEPAAVAQEPEVTPADEAPVVIEPEQQGAVISPPVESGSISTPSGAESEVTPEAPRGEVAVSEDAGFQQLTLHAGQPAPEPNQNEPAALQLPQPRQTSIMVPAETKDEPAVEQQVEDDSEGEDDDVAIAGGPSTPDLASKGITESVAHHSDLLSTVGAPNIQAAVNNAFILEYTKDDPDALPDKVVATEAGDGIEGAVPVGIGYAKLDPAKAADATEHVEHFVPAADDLDEPITSHEESPAEPASDTTSEVKAESPKVESLPVEAPEEEELPAVQEEASVAEVEEPAAVVEEPTTEPTPAAQEPASATDSPVEETTQQPLVMEPAPEVAHAAEPVVTDEATATSTRVEETSTASEAATVEDQTPAPLVAVAETGGVPETTTEEANPEAEPTSHQTVEPVVETASAASDTAAEVETPKEVVPAVVDATVEDTDARHPETPEAAVALTEDQNGHPAANGSSEPVHPPSVEGPKEDTVAEDDESLHPVQSPSAEEASW